MLVIQAFCDIEWRRKRPEGPEISDIRARAGNTDYICNVQWHI